jgi:hypothetical protein
VTFDELQPGDSLLHTWVSTDGCVASRDLLVLEPFRNYYAEKSPGAGEIRTLCLRQGKQFVLWGRAREVVRWKVIRGSSEIWHGTP